MRVSILLAFLTLSTQAQTATESFLSRGIAAVITGQTPVSAEDQSVLIKLTAEILEMHITFRPDGTASSTCFLSVRQPVEWKNFAVSGIHVQPITEADRLNGTPSGSWDALSGILEGGVLFEIRASGKASLDLPSRFQTSPPKIGTWNSELRNSKFTVNLELEISKIQFQGILWR